MSANAHVLRSNKLANVLYDIRGPLLVEAKRLEAQGEKILKLNIGNTAPFGLDAPQAVLQDLILHLPQSQGYSDSKGVLSARSAIQEYHRAQGVTVDIEDIYIGNGVSELILMTMQCLLNSGDEMLIPSPDYPLWTAAVRMSGGKPVHYICDESADWTPDIADIESKIGPRTRGIVVINPNNPTGSVYPPEISEAIHRLAATHNLIIFADEIYEKIIYDAAAYSPLAPLCNDTLCVTFNGLSKAYRAPGLRAGWMAISGRTDSARDYLEGLGVLASMRLCSNVPAQFAIQSALDGKLGIDNLIVPGGRLFEQRTIAHELLNDIPGVSCVKARGAIYMFPRLDPERFGIKDDVRFAFDLLTEKHILVVNGSGFNHVDQHHFRIVFLPERDRLATAFGKIREFLSDYHQE